MMNPNTLANLEQTALFEIVGRMTGDNSLTLLPALDDALAAGQTRLVLDLSGVEYMNSAGLRSLVQMYERARRKGGTLILANPSERVQTLLELVGLDSVMDILTSSGPGLPDLTTAALSVLPRRIFFCS